MSVSVVAFAMFDYLNDIRPLFALGAVACFVLWLSWYLDHIHRELEAGVGYNKQTSERLRISEERFRIAFSCSDDAIFEYDPVQKRYLDFTNSSQLIGRSCEEINSELATVDYDGDWNEVIARYFYHPSDVDKCLKEIAKAQTCGEASFVARLNTALGDCVWCKVNLLVVANAADGSMRVFGHYSNIDDLKRQSDVFKVRADKDALTGFYNKAATVRLISDVLTRSYKDDHVMLALDLDNFKQINDTMGHITGDAVLAEACERMRGLFRNDDILGRIGGDEFVILVCGLRGEENIIRKVNDIIEAFRVMSINAGGVINMSVSIGVDIPPKQPCSYSEIFSHADLALYEAKRRGKNGYVFYDSSFDQTGLKSEDGESTCK